MPVTIKFEFAPNTVSTIENIKFIDQTTNVNAYEIIFNDNSSTKIAVIDNLILNFNIENLPTTIQSLTVNITSTSDNQAPRNVKLSIQRCYEEYITSSTTTTTTTPTTRTTITTPTTTKTTSTSTTTTTTYTPTSTTSTTPTTSMPTTSTTTSTTSTLTTSTSTSTTASTSTTPVTTTTTTTTITTSVPTTTTPSTTTTTTPYTTTTTTPHSTTTTTTETTPLTTSTTTTETALSITTETAVSTTTPITTTEIYPEKSTTSIILTTEIASSQSTTLTTKLNTFDFDKFNFSKTLTSTTSPFITSTTSTTLSTTTTYPICMVDLVFINFYHINVSSSGIIGYVYENNTYSNRNGTRLVPVYQNDYLLTGVYVFIDECKYFICNETVLYYVETDNCSHPCEYLEWSNWSKCSGRCNVPGIQTRYKQRLSDNPLCEENKVEIQPCYDTTNCTDCEVSDWSQWSNCSKPCGGGITNRTRNLLVCPNITCENRLVEYEHCNKQCCVLNAEWTDWGEWSTCSSNNCTAGTRRRLRVCSKSDCEGSTCSGPSVQTESCLSCNQPLPTCGQNMVPSDCANNCSMSCATLSCLNQCQMPETCVSGCVCAPGLVFDANGNCIPISDCPCSVGSISLARYQVYETDCKKFECKLGCLDVTTKTCAPTCDLSEWSAWSDCTSLCTGVSRRFRNTFGPGCTGNTTIFEQTKYCNVSCTCDYIDSTTGITYTFNVSFVVVKVFI